jgi:hypothetical protein
MGQITLTDNEFIAKGGQASIYQYGGYAFKIYHNASSAIPQQKIEELEKISLDNVVKPLDIIFDGHKKMLGYIMTFISSGHPICKLFTKSFKSKNAIDPNDIINLIAEIQKSVKGIHGCRCLIVDFNEFNLMTDNTFKVPIFIDTDSYQTPNFPASAIMESIRDPLVKQHNYTELSDWYSFAIIAFQLYIGIHPFKGGHPKFARDEWRKRMDMGVSVLEKDSTIPSVCSDISVIPKRHYDWFKVVFSNKDRSIPPVAGSIAPIQVPAVAITILRKSSLFDVSEVFKIDEDITDVYSDLGITFLLSRNYIWKDGRKYSGRTDKETFILFQNGKEIVVTFDGNNLHFHGSKNEVICPADKVMYKDNRIYSIYEDEMYEHCINEISGKTISTKREICHVIPQQVKLFEGVAIQTAIDKTIMILPFEQGKCYVKCVPELDEYRVLSARGESNVVIVIGEKDKKYHRIIFVFSKDFSSYTVRIVPDVQSADVTFTVMPSGVCALAIGSGEIELFKDNKTVRSIDKAPFDSSMYLYNTLKGLHFVERNRVFFCKMK